jgi:ribosomal protein S12 methylthiotransferase accessory factor
VTLLHPGDQGCFASFGAHPRFEIALERALTELLQGRALDALAGFPEPGFDLDEAASSQNLEIHFVDSSGIVHWNFLGDTPDFPFHHWNFSTTTAEDYVWLVDSIHAAGRDIYVADFSHLGVYACRILVPGMSEIYPIDELEYENNSVANALREAILHLADLDDEECADLLDTLNESNLADQRPVAGLIGLAPDEGTLWADLRVGELKTLLALAIGDRQAIEEGCHWIRHFEQINAERRKVYRCIECLLEFRSRDTAATCAMSHDAALRSLYGADTLARAQALLDGELRFFGLPSPGLDLVGCETHQRLLAAYGKLHGRKTRA